MVKIIIGLEPELQKEILENLPKLFRDQSKPSKVTMQQKVQALKYRLPNLFLPPLHLLRFNPSASAIEFKKQVLLPIVVPTTTSFTPTPTLRSKEPLLAQSVVAKISR
jgi:hypothetical protein